MTVDEIILNKFEYQKGIPMRVKLSYAHEVRHDIWSMDLFGTSELAFLFTSFIPHLGNTRLNGYAVYRLR